VSWKATGWVLAYYLFSALLWRFLPGVEMEGGVLSSGGRLKYKFNGMRPWTNAHMSINCQTD
jgi:Delta14-sterol reductase